MEDKKLLIQTSALIAENLDNQDLISSCVNIRYGGDYEREEAAKEDMYFTYVEIAYITLRSLKPLLSWMSAQSWKRLLMETINNIGIKIGFVYQGNDESSFEEEANTVYSFLTKKTRKPKASENYVKEFENLVNQLVEHAVYPMTDEVYKDLLEDRKLDFPQENLVKQKNMNVIKISRKVPVVYFNDEIFDCPFVVNDKLYAKYLKEQLSMKPRYIKAKLAEGTLGIMQLIDRVGSWIVSEYNVNPEPSIDDDFVIYTF